MRSNLLTGITFTEMLMVKSKHNLVMKNKRNLMILQEECFKTKSMGLVNKSYISLFANVKEAN